MLDVILDVISFCFGGFIAVVICSEYDAWPGNSEVSICCDAGLWDIHYIRADPCDAAEWPEIY